MSEPERAAGNGPSIFPSYCRERPSPQYKALLCLYQDMHRAGYRRISAQGETAVAASDAYAGEQLLHYLGHIRALARQHDARRILDYGAGKGTQYRDDLVIRLDDGKTEFRGIKAFWGVDSIDCYEPGLSDGPPEGSFHGVVCTDVLEHCFAADLPWIVEELFRLADRFVFANIACYPAAALLPNGENAHTTLRPPTWWQGFFDATANRFPGCDFLLACAEMGADGRHVHHWYRRQRYGEQSADRFRR
jgi:hypothetical protein